MLTYLTYILILLKTVFSLQHFKTVFSLEHLTNLMNDPVKDKLTSFLICIKFYIVILLKMIKIAFKFS